MTRSHQNDQCERVHTSETSVNALTPGTRLHCNRYSNSRSCIGGLTSINSEIVSSRANETDEAEVTEAVEKIKMKTKESIDPVQAVYQQ